MLKLTEDEARGLDAIYKGVGILALVLGAAWTLTQYFLHRAEERETATIEARRPFLEKRLQVYGDLVLTAGTIASSDDADEVKKAKKQLDTLSSGLLIVFEEPDVRTARVEFLKCANDSGCSGQAMVLRSLAAKLAVTCRNSIGEGWGLTPPRPPTDIKATAH